MLINSDSVFSPISNSEILNFDLNKGYSFLFYNEDESFASLALEEPINYKK